MQDGGRLQAAIDVLEDIFSKRRPAAAALKDWGLAHRFAGSGDRAAIGNLVYDALRKRLSLAHRMGADTPRALVLGTYTLDWQNDLERLDVAIDADRHAPSALTDAERVAIRTASLDDAPDHVRADIPDWLWPRFEKSFGDRAVEEGAGLAVRAPVDLRANTLKTDRDTVLSALSRFNPVETPLSPAGIRLNVSPGAKRAPYVQAEAGFKKGWFEVQDEASQIAAMLAGGFAGAQVVDFCAGAGGKTLALAAQMKNAGQIYAYDADARRFADIRERLKRAGVRNAQIRMPHDEGALSDLEGHADLVLVDAPCTGTGTWRRRPDAKWRLAPGAIDQRIVEQDKVLADAARFVKPGGRLVYVTCSLLPDENEERISAFLAENGTFSLSDPAENWLTAMATPMPAGVVAPVAGHGNAIRLTPASTGTDGFFVAVMTRSG